jgi:TonB-dependent SusC/RagA subfamily outer membrane receptor
MPTSFLYFAKLSASLALVWLLYQLLFRKLTFYRWNRWYLLGYTLLSFFIPLINIEPILEKSTTGEPLVLQFIPNFGNYVAGETSFVRSASWTTNLWYVFLAIIGVGALVLLVRLTMRYLSLRRIRLHAKLITDRNIRIYQVDDHIRPFSFGNAIYINQHLHTEKEWEEIILHEYIHIRQQHTVDILLAEIFCILNWYNPFVWLIRHSIRQNLEFIADSKVLENGFDKKSYQYHLLRVIGEPRYRLANNFNFSSLKKRIVMMNKIRSARLHLIKFLFILPLIGVLLVAFRDKYDGFFHRSGKDVAGRDVTGRDVAGDNVINVAGVIVDVVSHRPLAGAGVVEKQSGAEATADARGFYHLQIPVTGDSVRIRIHFTLKGYGEDKKEFFFPSRDIIGTNHGVIADALLLHDADKYPYVMAFPYMGKVPDDPTYDDAQQALTKIIQDAEGWTRWETMRKTHPEVALFYSSEGNQRQIVVLQSGEVERYNFPGGPGLADMEKKYGPLPEVMTARPARMTNAYLDRWNAIAARAEKEFHTANTNALHIIFPGDSRVLAVPRNGKPQVYDMMNADPKERPSFERLYGKLPDFVPATSISTHTGELTDPPAAMHSPKTDTTPAKVTIRLDKSSASPLFVLNGNRMPAEWKIESIPSDSIFSINVLKGDTAIKLYGKKAADGVIQIRTKDFVRTFESVRPINATHPLLRPLVMVDGVVRPWKDIEGKDGQLAVNPAEIESVSVLKGDSAVARYGDQALNGVILIQLKKKTTLYGQPKVTIDGKDGRTVIQADSISVNLPGNTISVTGAKAAQQAIVP